MIGIIDYGMGNLRSVENALKKLGKESVISGDPDVLSGCEKLILPGVGAFPDCMANIHQRGLYEPIRKMVSNGTPLLGICLGMQMLYEASEEMELTKGFGFLKGTVKKMETDLPIPQIGWNELVFDGHSYCACDIEESQLYGYSMYGDIRVPGLVGKDNILGAQFHPEKSGREGLAILKYFVEESV